MKTKFAGSTVIAAILAATGGIAASARTHHAPPISNTSTSPTPLQAIAPPTLIAGYRGWTRVNPQPVPISSVVAFLCRSVSPAESAADAANPHLASLERAKQDPSRTRYATVYVNPVGQEAMMTQKNPVFPEGSVIVKEKQVKPRSDWTPELLTVMRKREKGYNPTGGDWEYLVYDGKGQKIQSQGRLENCISCHAASKATDYVARTYLTDAAVKALK